MNNNFPEDNFPEDNFSEDNFPEDNFPEDNFPEDNFPEDKSRENKSNFEKFKKNILPKLIPHLKRNIIPQLRRNIIPILTIGVAVAGSIYICKPLLTKALIYKTIRTIRKNENPITGFEALPLILVKEAKRVTNKVAKKAVEKTIIDHSLRDFCFQLVRQNSTTLVAILVCSALSMYAESSQYKAIKEVDKAIKNIIESKSSFDD